MPAAGTGTGPCAPIISGLFMPVAKFNGGTAAGRPAGDVGDVGVAFADVHDSVGMSLAARALGLTEAKPAFAAAPPLAVET